MSLSVVTDLKLSLWPGSEREGLPTGRVNGCIYSKVKEAMFV